MSKPCYQYDVVINYIKEGILNGTFPLTSKLPSENSIAQTLGVSRVTVRKALTTLKDEGFIESHQGSGSFVKLSQSERYIPVIVSSAGSSSRFFDIYNGIQTFFSEHNFTPLLTITDDDYKTELLKVKESLEKGFKRMIILPCESTENNAFYHSLQNSGCDIVFVDVKPNSLDCDCITSCNFNGGYIATKHLIEQGHRRIAITFTKNHQYTNTLSDRFKGYLSALKEYNLPFDESLVFYKEWGISTVQPFVDNFIASNVNATAVFCTADCIAVPLANSLAKANKAMAVVGFDNVPATESNTPSITTIDQDFYQMGYNSAKLLYQRMLNPHMPITHLQIPVKLITRESSRIAKKFF